MRETRILNISSTGEIAVTESRRNYYTSAMTRSPLWHEC